MDPGSISSPSHPLLKEFSKLQNSRRYRKQAGRIALEGPNLVAEALKAGLTPEVILFSDDYYENKGRSITAGMPGSVRQYVMPPRLFKKIADTEAPQPVAAIFFFNQPVFERELHRPPALALLLDRIQDPGNMGTMIRTATGAGAEIVYYSSGSTDPFGPKVLRATAGAVFNLHLEEVSDPLHLIDELKKKGLQVVAAAAGADNLYWDVDFRPPTILIVGNEAGGIAPELMLEADLKVAIPLYGQVESLNAAAATAVLLYEIVRQRSM